MAELMPQIIAESADWLVVNKPASWLTIAGRSRTGEASKNPVLIHWLRSRYPEARIVHRLDQETSGVILFARTRETHREACIWFQKRQVKKQYCCLASGTASLPIMKIQTPIQGAACTTQVEVRERFAGAFFAHVRPLTGRRHQIRIHLAGQDCPILGDVTYGGARSLADIEIKRVALHAMSLEIPDGSRFLKFEAPLPDDFQGWLNRLRSEETRT
jgi:23S rRNA-/tRNA-specific pseudouridylate synthase